MHSWTQLAVELSTNDRVIAEKHKKAAAAVRRSEQGLQSVAAKQQDLEEKHRLASEDIVRRNGFRMDALQKKAEQDIAAAEAATKETDEKTKEVQKRRDDLLSESKALEDEVRMLYGLLAKTREDHERRFEEARQAADDEVQQSWEAARLKIQDTSTFATEARDSVNAVMDGMQTNFTSALADVHARSEQRSRYEAYTKLAMHRTELDSSQARQARHGLMQEWWDDWNQSLPVLRAPASPRRNSVNLASFEDKDQVLEAVSSWRAADPDGKPPLRAKDRAIAHAENQRQLSLSR
mmetsp:Transcript_29985/g.69780  ORF Transcript_29985/g.69780 Transcript_29985/m.69780 type:complete len:294 (-) Transcript_29985:66-947(-)